VLGRARVEFLVRIAISLTADVKADERVRLLEAERRRGRGLVDDGSIMRIWRIGDESSAESGRLENVGLWRASDEPELRVLLGSLPLYPWMTIDVTPLRRHPLEDD
jgi:muconolactone D-isomerase